MSDKNNNKNDKFLMIAKPVFFAVLVALVVVWVITVIVTFMSDVLSGFVALISGAIPIVLYALIVPLVLSYLVDVKIMRNKMLGRQQPELENYWEGWTGIFLFVIAGRQPAAQEPAEEDRQPDGEDEEAE